MKTQPSYLKTVGTGLACSAALHVLHLGEARFVLQNRLPNFATYPSYIAMLRGSLTQGRWEFFNGMPGYLPILAITTLMTKSILGLSSIYQVFAQMAALQALAYPFLTAQRRMEAQSPKTAGMLHARYENYLHCLYHINKEEGLRGFYRGFPLYLLATGVVTLLVPMAAEMAMHNTELYGHSRDRENERLEAEVSEGRERIERKKKQLKERSNEEK